MSRFTLATCIFVLLGLATTAGLEAQGTDTAVYQVRFKSTWSAQTHPNNFPSNPHFSGLIGGVHNDQVSFWQEGGIASDGMEQMAERGQQSPLDAEVQAAIDAGTARAVISAGGIGTSPGNVSTTFTVTRNYPLLTLVTMVAPSPDWFVGVSGLSLVENGDWINEKVVTLYGWDAGTDNGGSYTAGDSNTSPRAPIALSTYGPMNNGTALGTFTFTRQDGFEPEALMLRNGRFKVTAAWKDFQLTRGNGQPIPRSDDTGYFWFFDQANVEAVVKVLDGCGINGHFWVFAGGLTSVEVELTVEDTETSQVSIYSNNLANPFQPIQDTEAFATCP